MTWILSLFGNLVAVGFVRLGTGQAAAHATGSLVAVVTAWTILGLATYAAPLSRHRELCLVFAMLGGAGSLCLAFASGSSVQTALMLVGTALSGCSASALFLAWHEYLATQGIRPALLIVCASCALACAAMVLLRAAPVPIRVAVNAALPFVSALTLRPERGTRFYMNAAAGLDKTPREVIAEIYHDHSPRLMCALSCVATAYGLVCTATILTGGESDGIYPLGFSIVTALSIAVAALAMSCLSSERLARAHYCALPCAACGVCLFYALYAVGPWQQAAMPVVSAISALLVGLGLFGTMFMIWAVMAQSARTKRLPVLGLFASLVASLLTGLVAGQTLAMAMTPRNTDAAFVVLGLLFVAAILVGSLNGRIGISDEVLSAPVEAERDARILALAEKSGLSPRETEVLQIWLAGHNAAYLEETLHISRNTVKTHLNHIYQKTGVSSKEGLIALVE